ncbi:MAG: ferrous iron transport protein A [Spirochaetia bacterium]|nr:ferrous iron transport protein A [Spirochaetia bacterium]
MKTILDLKINQEARIINISISAGKDFINDIMDHGIFPGSLVVVSEFSQSSDKIIFISGDNLISIRKTEAKYIYVDEIFE